MLYSFLKKEGDIMYRVLGSTDILMYDLLGIFGFFAVLVYNFSMFRYKRNLLSNSSLTIIKIASKKNKNNLFSKANFWTVIEIFLISCVQHLPIIFLNSKFGSLMETGTNYFGLLFFIPLFLLLLYYAISINPFKQTDLIAPAYPLALIFIKLACFCNGCCQGFECEWGLTNYYNMSDPKKEFPAQLLEAGLAFAIFIFLLLYRKKAKEGTLFPIYVIVYSGTRFFSEFTRNDPNVLGILKTYHIFCIIGVIVGIVELILVLKFSEKITPIFDRPVFTWRKEKNIVHHKIKNKK